MNFKTTAMLFSVLPLFFSAAQPPEAIQFLQVRLSDAKQKAANQQKLLLVHFTARWCMPCQWMDQNTFTEPQLAAYINANYLPVKIDIDDVGGNQDKELCKVNLLPSTLIFSASGELIGRYEESMDAQRLMQILQRHNLPQHRIAKAQPSAPSTTGLSPSASMAHLNKPPLVPASKTNAQVQPEAARPSQVSTQPVLTPKPVAPAPVPPASTNAALPAPKPAVNNQPANPIPTPAAQPASAKRYGIQIGAFANYDNVSRQVVEMEARYKQPVKIFQNISPKGETFYKVVIGDFPTLPEANSLLDQLIKDGMAGYVRDLGSM